jgi:hypothetical protein
MARLSCGPRRSTNDGQLVDEQNAARLGTDQSFGDECAARRPEMLPDAQADEIKIPRPWAGTLGQARRGKRRSTLLRSRASLGQFSRAQPPRHRSRWPETFALTIVDPPLPQPKSSSLCSKALSARYVTSRTAEWRDVGHPSRAITSQTQSPFIATFADQIDGYAVPRWSDNVRSAGDTTRSPPTSAPTCRRSIQARCGSELLVMRQRGAYSTDGSDKGPALRLSTRDTAGSPASPGGMLIAIAVEID